MLLYAALLLAAAPDWAPLFDGRTLAGWHVSSKPADRDKNFWTVRDGAITCDSLGRKDHDYVWLLTDGEFADFELKLKVRGFSQSPGNSGVQLRSHYDEAAGWLDGPQVDIHPPGPWRTGLIYDETRGVRHWISPSLPDSKIEPAQGPKEWKWNKEGWNEVEIVCQGPRIRTRVNGVMIADYDGRGVLDDKLHRPGGRIGLQLHVRDELLIQYKDIFVRPILHAWEKHEIGLTARNATADPYVGTDVWVDLRGPGFNKRVYGFWDGGTTFRVRVTATAPGRWEWVSGSNRDDAGLNGKRGAFSAVAWTEEEKRSNAVRRGFPRASTNRHALEYPDGTPFFLLGDTWWATATNRFRWHEDERERIGPEAGFKDWVRLRQRQGFNSVAMIAAFPAWADDGRPPNIILTDPQKTVIRSAWPQPGTGSAKDMANEGGRAFLFPGRIPGMEEVFPDVDRINPAYFRELDKKIDYLNQHGFIPFIEVARRDLSQAWKRFHKWPESYARYIQYVWSRYQANNVILSPIHFDTRGNSIPAAEYQSAIEIVRTRYGSPAFGSLVSTNSSPSTLVNSGDAPWLTLHQTGNWREHDYYWYLTEIFRSPKPRPALNGEPYYTGLILGKNVAAPGGTEADGRYCRSAMYGSFLSGGFAGHIYGAQGIWDAAIEDAAKVKMWDAFQWKSAEQIRHLAAFALSEGRGYQELVPDADLVSPNKTAERLSYEGWAYCARTPDRRWFLLYFEKGWAGGVLRGALREGSYRARWFNPRTGEWTGAGELRADAAERAELPARPDGDDWGLSLLSPR